MNDTDFKRSLNELGPAERVCILYLERKLNEVAVKPLKVIKEYMREMDEKHRQTNELLGALEDEGEQVTELMSILVKLREQLSPGYDKKMREAFKESLREARKEAEDEFEYYRIIYDKRIELLEKTYKKFDKLFSDNPHMKKFAV